MDLNVKDLQSRSTITIRPWSNDIKQTGNKSLRPLYRPNNRGLGTTVVENRLKCENLSQNLQINSSMKMWSRSDNIKQTGKYSPRSNYRPNMVGLGITVVEKWT